MVPPLSLLARMVLPLPMLPFPAACLTVALLSPPAPVLGLTVLPLSFIPGLTVLPLSFIPGLTVLPLSFIPGLTVLPLSFIPGLTVLPLSFISADGLTVESLFPPLFAPGRTVPSLGIIVESFMSLILFLWFV